MSSFEILCVTMHQKDFSKIEQMNIHSNVVFANQCNKTSYEEIEFDGNVAKMISTNTKGVGINRNLALMYASADICLLADDDVVYNEGYESIIRDFYEQHPDADVTIFNFMVSRNGSVPRQIISKTEKLKKRKLSYGTYAISFRRSVIEWHNIKFHTQFGGGALYSCGEDSAFLNDCFKKKLTIYTCETNIGCVNHRESTWFNGYSEKHFVDKGVLFYLLTGSFALPAAFYHCLKHKKEYNEFGWKKAFHLMKKGIMTAKKSD